MLLSLADNIVVSMASAHDTILDNGTDKFHVNLRLRTGDQKIGQGGAIVRTIPNNVLLRAAKVGCVVPMA